MKAYTKQINQIYELTMFEILVQLILKASVKKEFWISSF